MARSSCEEGVEAEIDDLGDLGEEDPGVLRGDFGGRLGVLDLAQVEDLDRVFDLVAFAVEPVGAEDHERRRGSRMPATAQPPPKKMAAAKIDETVKAIMAVKNQPPTTVSTPLTR